MAITIPFAGVLMELAKKSVFKGHLVAISKYNCWFSVETALSIARHVEFKPIYTPSSTGKDEGENGSILGGAFFKMLGFTCVTEIEYEGSGEENCVLMDLNNPETPEGLIASADAIFDFGSSEHIFHFPNVLSHINNILKSGGFVLHHLPSNNHVNHGFYQFSPILFFDYYRANGYEPKMCLLNRFDSPGDPAQEFYDISGEKEWQEYALDARASMSVFLAQKIQETSPQVFPIQRIYVNP